MSIGYNLRKFRTRTNKSQQEIADLLGIERRTYINWENEQNDVKSEYIPKLADIFGVEIQELFDNAKTNIEIKQEIKENNDNSVNGIILILTDKQSVDELVNVIKDRFNK